MDGQQFALKPCYSYVILTTVYHEVLESLIFASIFYSKQLDKITRLSLAVR